MAGLRLGWKRRCAESSPPRSGKLVWQPQFPCSPSGTLSRILLTTRSSAPSRTGREDREGGGGKEKSERERERRKRRRSKKRRRKRDLRGRKGGNPHAGQGCVASPHLLPPKALVLPAGCPALHSLQVC